MSALTFIILSLATYRATRFVLQDRLFDRARNWVWDRCPPETTRTGYLLTCPWCLGFWFSLAFVTCYTIVPAATLFIASVLALSAVVGWLSALENRL